MYLWKHSSRKTESDVAFKNAITDDFNQDMFTQRGVDGEKKQRVERLHVLSFQQHVPHAFQIILMTVITKAYSSLCLVSKAQEMGKNIIVNGCTVDRDDKQSHYFVLVIKRFCLMSPFPTKCRAITQTNAQELESNTTFKWFKFSRNANEK